MTVMTSQRYSDSLWLRWGPAALLMVAIFVFSSLPSDEIPSFGTADLLAKKGGHFIGYAALAVSYWWGFQLHRRAIKHAWLLSVLYALTDEFHQSFVPGRGPLLLDVAIDSVGAFFGLLFFSVFARSLFSKL